MGIKVRGTKVIFRHNYVPRWMWIVSLLIMWNAVMFGFFITHPVSYALIVFGVLVPIIMPMLMSTIYVITDKEIVVVKRKKIIQRVRLDDTLDFKSSNVKAYIFSLGQPVGDIDVYRISSGETVLTIKGVRNPDEKIRFIRSELKKSKW